MQMSENQHRATGELVELFAHRLGANRAVHAETAIASAARVSGSLLLRSFQFDLDAHTPGALLLSKEANAKWPGLVNLVLAYLQGSHMSLDATKLGDRPEQRGEEPTLTLSESLELLQGDALLIAERHGLSLERAAEAAALATGFILRECSGAIGIETGFNVAAHGVLEGAKTVPPRLAPQVEPAAKKAWYRFW